MPLEEKGILPDAPPKVAGSPMTTSRSTGSATTPGGVLVAMVVRSTPKASTPLLVVDGDIR